MSLEDDFLEEESRPNERKQEIIYGYTFKGYPIVRLGFSTYTYRLPNGQEMTVSDNH
jgi:hypothetical protein